MFNPNTRRDTGTESNYDQWKELESIRREHGGVETPHEDRIRGALSQEELTNWQGEHGERYRGMMPMNAEQAAAWRKESFGTMDVDLAEISKQASAFNYLDKTSVDNVLDSLVEEPDAVRSVVEHRIKEAFAKIDWRDLNSEKTFADLMFIDGAMQRGMDLENTQIDISTLVGDKEMVPVTKALDKLSDYYDRVGLKIANPDKPEEKIKASNYARHIIDGAKERSQNVE